MYRKVHLLLAEAAIVQVKGQLSWAMRETA